MTHPGFRFERDQERRRIVITLSANVTVGLWRTTVSTLVAENAWRDPLLYDMSAVDSTSLLLNLPNLVPVVADLTKTHGRRGAVAAVVPSSDLSVWRLRLPVLFRDFVEIDAFS